MPFLKRSRPKSYQRTNSRFRRQQIMSYRANDVVIVSARRTPIGCFRGAFSTIKARDLGAAVIKDILENINCVKREDISEVIIGQVLTAGAGQNPARQTVISSGLSVSVPATTVDMACGSGLRAVALGKQAIDTGDSVIVIAGGQENMSQVPHCIDMRSSVKMGDVIMKDVLIETLTDPFGNYHMGVTAENVSRQWEVTREQQDRFAEASQKKAAQAQKNEVFKDEIVPVTVKTGKGSTVVSEDEHPRNNTTMETLSRLKPFFITDGTGTVTAGNASGLNDGAAAVMMMSYETASKYKLAPLARIVAWAQVGIEPSLMGAGPIPATRAALSKAGWCMEDVELFEINEAFASQSCAVISDLGINLNKVNINGGAIALGHPLGASGCRILVTLLHSLKRTDRKRGVAALCVGGGMGIAMCVERLSFSD